MLRHKHSAFDDVIELANISGKSMLQQTVPGSFIKTANLFPITLRVLPEETVGERHDVLSSISQRRQRNPNCVQAKQEGVPTTTSARLIVKMCLSSAHGA